MIRFFAFICLLLCLGGWTHGGLTPPPQASAAGFTSLAFSDDFDSLATIDVNNTKAAGYKWYVDSNWQATGWGSAWSLILNGIAIPAANISVSNSVLTISKPPLGSIYHLFSAAENGANGFTGRAFGNGFYIEGRIKYTPAAVPDATGWVALWANPSEFFTGTATKFSEWDILEAFPAENGRQWATHYWDKAINNNSPVAGDDHSASTLPADSSFHIYGMLWVPISKGAGTGSVKIYIDNVLVATAVTYTAGQDYAVSDALNYFLIINCGAGTAASDTQVDWVRVWQSPS